MLPPSRIRKRPPKSAKKTRKASTVAPSISTVSIPLSALVAATPSHTDTLYCHLTGIQDQLGSVNSGMVYALYDYESQNGDELNFSVGDVIQVLQKGDEQEKEWWWSKMHDQEGYVPRNLIGVRH